MIPLACAREAGFSANSQQLSVWQILKKGPRGDFFPPLLPESLSKLKLVCRETPAQHLKEPDNSLLNARFHLNRFLRVLIPAKLRYNSCMIFPIWKKKKKIMTIVGCWWLHCISFFGRKEPNLKPVTPVISAPFAIWALNCMRSSGLHSFSRWHRQESDSQSVSC